MTKIIIEQGRGDSSGSSKTDRETDPQENKEKETVKVKDGYFEVVPPTIQ